MNWARILAYVTGTVDQELLLRNEYLAAENRILKAKLKGRVRFSDAERARLGEIGHRLGCKGGCLSKLVLSVSARCGGR
jgi:putative transposase